MASRTARFGIFRDDVVLGLAGHHERLTGVSGHKHHGFVELLPDTQGS